MNWNRYKQLDRDMDALMRASPVTVEFSFDEFRELKNTILLLRRIIDNMGDSDLAIVERQFAAVGGRIYEAFKKTPGTAELRAEQMQMLERGATTPPRSGIPESDRKENA